MKKRALASANSLPLGTLVTLHIGSDSVGGCVVRRHQKRALVVWCDQRPTVPVKSSVVRQKRNGDWVEEGSNASQAALIIGRAETYLDPSF